MEDLLHKIAAGEQRAIIRDSVDKLSRINLCAYFYLLKEYHLNDDEGNDETAIENTSAVACISKLNS